MDATRSKRTPARRTLRNKASPKYAIVHLLFKSESYLIGACICGYVHQQFRKKYNLKFDLILMVDEPLYKYKKELEPFFDQIRLIDMLPIKLSKQYTSKIPPKYAETMSLFTTKLNVFQLHEYTKVLFLDIDILPVSKEFYTIFKYKTPATVFRTHRKHTQIYSKKIHNLSEQSQYLNVFLEGGIFLVSPTKTDFKDSITFMHESEGTHGYSSHQASAPDETIILNYLALKKNLTITNIPHEYCIVPWDVKYKQYYNTTYSYNYLSNIKPWNTPLFMSWKETYIYYFLSEKIIQKSILLKRIHYRNIAKTIMDYEASVQKGNLSARCSKDPAVIDICSTAITTANKSNITPLFRQNNSYEVYDSMKSATEEILETLYKTTNDVTKIDMTTYGSIDKQLQIFYKIILS